MVVQPKVEVGEEEVRVVQTSLVPREEVGEVRVVLMSLDLQVVVEAQQRA